MPIVGSFYLHAPNQVIPQGNSIPHAEPFRIVKESLSEREALGHQLHKGTVR